MTSVVQDVPEHKAEQTVATGAAVNPAMPIRRVASVDVYRGFVMLLMMGEVLSLQSVSEALQTRDIHQQMPPYE